MIATQRNDKQELARQNGTRGFEQLTTKGGSRVEGESPGGRVAVTLVVGGIVREVEGLISTKKKGKKNRSTREK